MNKKIFVMIEETKDKCDNRINFLAEQEQRRLEILEMIMKLPEEIRHDEMMRLIKEKQ